MIPDTRVAIVGLGLMGGSLARALHARGARVLGYDRNVEHLDHAMSEGIVHEALLRDLRGVESAEVVVLALPVEATRQTIPLLRGRLAPARLVMDVASTNHSIVECAESAGIGERFVGTHPLTGSHRSGWGAARASLFEGSRVFLCPTRSTTPDALRLAESFWRELRAGTEALDAGVHDDEMAWRSHLPHIVSSALAVTLRETGVRRSALGPGGRDMTRLAGSSTAMWSSIAADNADAIVEALAAYEHRLRAFREAIARSDTAATRVLLDAGRDWFDGEPDGPITPRAKDA
ncbi:MAG: prephenate dehydrogenase [Gemmatimonadales bacterium]